MLRLRLPHGGQRGHPPAGRDALRRWFADRHTVLLAGPGLGRAPPMSVRPCSAGTPRGPVPCWTRRTERTGSGEVQGGSARKHDPDAPPRRSARLLGLTVPEVQADREGAAVSLAEKYHCAAVLKGHHTLVAAPDGTVWRNETGNAGLAKGGSGGYFSRSDRRAAGSRSKAGPHARGRRGLRGMASRRRCRPLRQAPQHDRHAAGGICLKI